MSRRINLFRRSSKLSLDNYSDSRRGKLSQTDRITTHSCPPLGPPVNVLISIGYGQEIDLQPGVQELWDPIKKSRLFIDHNLQKTYYEDPRPPKPSPLRIDCKQIMYGPDRKDPRIIQTNQGQATIDYHAERAYRKKGQWGACVIAKGRDGAHGRAGQNGGSRVQRSQRSCGDNLFWRVPRQ